MNQVLDPERVDAHPFAKLGLTHDLLAGVARMGYDEPTPIQEQAIPQVLDGPRRRRLRPDGHRQDGGLRAADPAAHRRRGGATRAAAAAPRPVALVVTPTRELAAQIDEVACAARRADGHRVDGRVRRHALRTVGQEGAPRRRHARRHTRPPARHGAARRRRPRHGPDPRPRRGRPHARHGLLARRAAHHRASCRRQAPEPALLGDHVAQHARRHRRHAARPGAHRRSAKRRRPVDEVVQKVYPVVATRRSTCWSSYFEHHKPERALVFTRTKHRADRLARER